MFDHQVSVVGSVTYIGGEEGICYLSVVQRENCTRQLWVVIENTASFG